MLVEREVGNEPFQSAVSFLQLPESTQLTHAQIGVFFLPGIEGGVTHPELPAQVADRGEDSACRIAYTICSSENVDHFMGPLPSQGTTEAAAVGGGDVLRSNLQDSDLTGFTSNS